MVLVPIQHDGFLSGVLWHMLPHIFWLQCTASFLLVFSLSISPNGRNIWTSVDLFLLFTSAHESQTWSILNMIKLDCFSHIFFASPGSKPQPESSKETIESSLASLHKHKDIWIHVHRTQRAELLKRCRECSLRASRGAAEAAVQAHGSYGQGIGEER